MQYILIFCALFVPLLCLSLFRAITRREWHYLWVQIPLYAVSLILNVLLGVGVRFQSITELLESFLSKFIK